MHREQIIYAGRVQGVGFRATVASIASRYPVTGWVRNEPDGTVRVEIQGDDAAVAAVRREIRSSRRSFIERETDTQLPATAGERTFEILR